MEEKKEKRSWMHILKEKMKSSKDDFNLIILKKKKKKKKKKKFLLHIQLSYMIAN